MSARSHFFFWGLICAGFVGFVFLFKAVLLPFVLGIAIAYLLNPVVGKLERLGLGRGVSTLLILFGFMLAISTFFAAFIPLLYKEILGFSEEFPAYIEQIISLFEPISEQFQSLIGYKNGDDLHVLVTKYADDGLNIAKHALQNVVAGGQAALDLLSVIIFMPVVAYFMMKEWDNITKWMDGLMPREHKKIIQTLIGQIDKKLSGFVRGQISVALILGVTYAIALSLAGLKYGFLIGIVSGLLSVIPMVGSVVGLVISVAVAWFQAGDLMFVGIIAAIFLVGQFIEGSFLTPKLVGDSVGLHPLWVFFALLAGGSLFGILGMLLAVPVAAVAGVLIAFALSQYKLSTYFKGRKNSSVKTSVKASVKTLKKEKDA